MESSLLPILLGSEGGQDTQAGRQAETDIFQGLVSHALNEPLWNN